MPSERRKIEDLAWDRASRETIEKSRVDGVDTCFSRMETQQVQCTFGKGGICCRICHMGPCRITKKAPLGVCGANADTIVARNFLREIVGGTAAHSDHARHLVLLLKKVGEGKASGYAVRDKDALKRTALLYGIDPDGSGNENGDGKTSEQVVLELAERLIGEFTSQEDPLMTTGLAPVRQQTIWENADVIPQGIDRMIVESMHRTHMGVDHDHRNILMHGFRTAIADGWGGSRIASMVSDILFGTPTPVRSTSNLGVLGKDTVNIIVHGHEPELSEMLAVAVQNPSIQDYAKQAGASGITLAGICCTANEILMRHGIPVAGNFLQQELAIVTGAVEMMIIDVQCCMPSLPDVASAYHTEIVSTTDMARTAGAIHLPFRGKNPGDPTGDNSERNTLHTSMDPLESARKLIKRAVDNYQNRDHDKVSIPSSIQPLVAGFSVEAIKYMLGGRFRASFRPLNDAIIQGRIKGVVGIVGCNNPKTTLDAYINILTKELIGKDVLVLKTGCAAIASAKEGMLIPEAALEYAGPGLREVCEAVGMPPVLHMGSCVDNSRILEAATEVVKEGGLGDDLSRLPAVGVAPEWMSEKAVAIGCYFVASGVDVVLGHPFHISGSENVTDFLNRETGEIFGGSFHVKEDPHEAVDLIMDLLTQARTRLGIDEKAERKLYDMKDRREGNV